MKLLDKRITKYLTLLVILLGTSISSFAQQIKVTGTVKDPGGEPLIGVSVRVQKTGTGAVTDIDGNFAVEVPSKSTLSFSYRSILLRYMLMRRTLTTRLIRRHT